MKNKLMDLLLGKPAPDDGAMQVSMDYGKDLQNYMDTLPQQSYAQNLYNGNLTKEQVNQGIANGLNFGIPQIKAKQEELKIRVPQTQAEIELARNGQFNNYPLVTSINNAPRQGGVETSTTVFLYVFSGEYLAVPYFVRGSVLVPSSGA